MRANQRIKLHLGCIEFDEPTMAKIRKESAEEKRKLKRIIYGWAKKTPVVVEYVHNLRAA